MAAAVVVVALVFWIGVFVVFFTSQGITASEFFLGRYESLPDDLGVWKQTGVDESDGVVREERVLLPEGRTNSGYLLQQVRYRDPVTGDIVRVEAERRVRRRRVSVRTR